MMFYDSQILETLKAAKRPLLHRDLVAQIAPDEYGAYGAIGNSLTRLFRAGMVAREKPGRWYEYTYVERPPIQAGLTWQDRYGPIVVMAVADGYAMVRRPGCLPTVMTVRDVEAERS